MRKGISSYSFAWAVGIEGKLPEKRISAFDLVDIAAEHKLDCVQLADNLPLHNFYPTQLQALKEFADKKNIHIEPGSRGLTEENLAKYIEIATFFKSDILRFVIDGVGYKPSIQEVITVINKFEKELSKHKIHLCIENHDRFLAKEFEKIIQGVGSNYVGICLDTVNSMGAGEGMETVIETLAPYTYNLHLKEFEIRRVWHMMGFIIEGKPLGEGMLPIDYILKKLHKRCKSMILEQWVPQQDTIEKTVQTEWNWGQKSIKVLKKL